MPRTFRYPWRTLRTPAVLLAAALAPVIAVAALLLTSLVAEASCAGGVSLQNAVRSAPTVFVGTVTETGSGGRVATVRVDDVWRGRALASVEVVGTPDLSAAATSVDRTYSVGTQYLFVPENGGPDRFTDNTCTATQLFSAGLRSVRPAEAPGAPAAADATFPLGLVLVTAMVLAIATLCVVALRRRGQAIRPA